jgi:hypothetical protein
MRYLLFCFFLPFSIILTAQNKTAFVSGKVLDENDKPLARVTIQILGKQKTYTTNDSGFFKMQVNAGSAFALVFNYVGYKSLQKNFTLNTGEEENIVIKLEHPVTNNIDTVTVKNNIERRESGRITIDPAVAILNPSPLGNIESLIKIFVGSNNELTSQYSVHGGSYDENLIYVNDFEVFKPYLVSNAQQEGLSFINPQLTGNVKFYTGGFQSKYGDKMSSALDVTYKKPKKFGGSAYLGLLEQGFHLEGTSNNNKFTYLFGVRNRTNRNILSSQATQGVYLPSSNDIQGQFTYQVSKKLQLELFANFSQTKFTFYPEESQLSSAVFTPAFSANLGLDVYFAGQEKDKYATNFVGIAATQQPNKNLKLKWLLSCFNDKEQENVDITAAYLFGERDFDNNSASYGLITNPLGAGVYQNFSRNQLNITLYNASHKGSLDKGKHFVQWGASIEQQVVNDKLNEWKYNDSAGYSLPYNPSNLQLFSVYKSKADFNLTRFTGYVQDNIQFKDSKNLILQIGVRYNYNTLNKELLISPRTNISFKPSGWKKDVLFKASLGIYNQPPFYREMRRPDGSLNTDLKAQKSWQVTAGMDYNFTMWQRPAKITTEAYYKNMWDVDPYDVDNVRVRYFGENNAKAYAVGIDTRLYAELVKDAESWISFGLMQTKEKIDNFYYYQYKNAAGEIIGSSTPDKVVTDSVKNNMGWVRRPTDRLVTFGMFFQDYLTTNKNFKFYLNTLYGSNLPYNIPGSVKYRNALIIDPYLRIDMGFSALLLDGDKEKRRSHSPFRNFESIWASLEIFNVIDRANTISYTLIKDFQNNVFAMPNRLTPRLVNLKLMVKW